MTRFRLGVTAVWVLAITTSLVATALALWSLSVDVVPVVRFAKSDITDLRDISLGQLVSDDSSALRDLHRRLETLDAKIAPAVRSVRWMGRFSPGITWIPVVQREVAAWDRNALRVKEDLAAAAALLDQSTLLLDAYEETQEVLTTAGNTSLSRLSDTARELEHAFSDRLTAIDGGAYSIVLDVPPARQAFASVASLEKRMLSANQLGQGVSGLLLDLLRIADGVQPMVGQFTSDNYNSEQWSAQTFRQKLKEVDKDVQSALVRAEDVAALLPDSGQLDEMHDQLETLVEVLQVLSTVSRAGTAGIESIDSLIQIAQDSSSGFLGTGERLILGFDDLLDHKDQIEEAISQLDEAKGRLARLSDMDNSSVMTGGISDLTDFTHRLQGGLRLIAGLAPVAGDLLGAGSKRNYLVLGHSADELRATGGFVSSIWLVTVNDGELTNVQYHDSVRVDDWERLMLYPKAPAGLEEHLNAWVWLMRDASWDPDFPTAALSAEDMFRLGQRQDVDGVIGINQWTLLRLLEALGSIPAPDGAEPITPRNLLSVLEQGTDIHGRAYMDLTLQGVIDTLSQPTSLATLVRLAAGVQEAFEERDLLVYLNSPDSQSLIEEMEWDGRVPQDTQDYLYVVDSNVGWNKVDRSIQRNVTYHVDLFDPSRPRASLTIGYTNHSGPGSPGCEPQWLSRGTDYSRLKNGCYWNYMRVYMPQGTTLLSSTSMPLPEYSVSVEIGKGVPGQETGTISSSHNKTVFSGLMAVEAGDRKEIGLVYDLPPSVLRKDGDRIEYQVLVQKQPGLRQRDVSVAFTIPEGYQLASSSVSPFLADQTRVDFRLQQTHNILLVVEFTRNADESS